MDCKINRADEWKRKMAKKFTLTFTFALKNTIIIELKNHVGT